MPKSIKKWIVKLRMFYADLRGHHGKNGTMSPPNVIWEEKEKNE